MEDTSDTLGLAAEERAKQGIHELEFSFGGEGDLHTHFKKCEKNPGHPMFNSLNELNTSHLPEHLATDKIIAWIRRMAQLTVKLSVRYVSPNRPPECPLFKHRGRRVLFVGSGHVTDYPREGIIEKMPCPFTNCADLPGDHEVFGYITIATAAHVVFDDEEAKNTTVEFFYDDPDDKSRVVTARGVKVGASSVEGDFCELLCVTHDAVLIRQLTYTFLPVQKGPKDKMIQSPTYTVYVQAVKLFVNYVSPYRPPGFPLSDCAGQKVLTVGSGRVVFAVPFEGNDGKLPCPFTKYADLPGYGCRGYITIATAAHVVFDDEEAKNTTVQFFYHDPDERRYVVTARGVAVRSCSLEKDFCELVCVTDDELFGKLTDNYHQGSVAQKKTFCDLFRTVLPGLEDIQCEWGKGLKFIVKISLSNPSEAVETFTALVAFTGEMVDSVLMHWDFSKNSLQDVLESARCQTQYMRSLIRCELVTAKSVDNREKTTPFLHLKKILTNMLDTFPNNNIDSPQMCQDMFSSLIIELTKYYSTIEIMKKRLYISRYLLSDIYFNNVQKVVDISNDTATVEVTFDREAHFTTLHHQKCILNWEQYGYFQRFGEFNQWKSTDTECQPEHPHFRDDECQSMVAINKLPVGHFKFSNQYVCELCNRKCHPKDNTCKPGYCKYMSEDSKYKSEDSKCNEDDMFLVHIGHPHGQSKRVTIGRQTDCWTGKGFYKQLYTAPTCPGCSGGPVWMIPVSGDLSDVYGVPHHGHHGNQVNSGCSWTMYPERFDTLIPI